MPLSTLVHGYVSVANREFPYSQWDGTCQSRLLAIDTETEAGTDLSRTVPRLAVAQVFDGSAVWLIHPRDLATFILRHADASYVAHNVSFDWHVIYHHLTRLRAFDAARTWLTVADEGRITCTMLQDQLLRTAHGSRNPVPRNLAELAVRRLDYHGVDKDDPWRLRYGELIDADWQTVPDEAWQYAARDAVVTRQIFMVQRDLMREMVAKHRIDRTVVEQFGPLTLRVQTRAAIALRQIELNGIGIDESRRDASRSALQDDVTALVRSLEGEESFQGVFKRDKHGSLMVTTTGKPRTNQKRLRSILADLADRYELAPPTTSKGDVTLSANYWKEHADVSPFVSLWLSLEEKTKLLQFFGKLQSSRIRPGYMTLTRTGRTSCKSPNVQQMPRSGSFRDMFIPRPGHVFVIVDYAAIELRTLAHVCETRFGYSVLADTFREGRDPHIFTAASLSGMTYDELKATEGTDTFKHRRQAAKAVNFGIPGGLGPDALVAYAKLQYKAVMTLDEAVQFRETFLHETYPEIGEYLVSDTATVLADNLHCKARHIRNIFKDDAALGAAKRIVQGRPHKRDGTPYKPQYVADCWDALRRLNHNPSLVVALQDEQAGESLERQMFFGTVVAPAGFIRGRVTFTQSRNTPFQSAAATGCKVALYTLFRSGYRVAAFVHDEFVIELPQSADLERHQKRIDTILKESMGQVTGTLPIETEMHVSDRWTK